MLSVRRTTGANRVSSTRIFGILLIILAVAGITAPPADQVDASIPDLNSNPNAPHILFLGFNGHTMPQFSVQVNGETREALETSILPFSLDSTRTR